MSETDWAVERLQIFGGKLLIAPEAPKERMRPDSRIIIPEMARDKRPEERWDVGQVVLIGPGMRVARKPRWKPGEPYRWPMPKVAIGARVLYRTWALRAELQRGDRKYHLVSDESIDAVIEDNMSIRPIGTRIIVRRMEAVTETAGGIIIPDVAREKPIEGIVLAVGDGEVQVNGDVRPLDVKIGDHVLFGKHAGTEVQVDGVKCVVMYESDVLGVVVKEDAA